MPHASINMVHMSASVSKASQETALHTVTKRVTMRASMVVVLVHLPLSASVTLVGPGTIVPWTAAVTTTVPVLRPLAPVIIVNTIRSD